MSPFPLAVRSMRGRREPARLYRALLLSALVSAWLGGAPGSAQPAAPPAGRLSIGTGGEQATVVADQMQQVGGAADLLVAIGNVEIKRGHSRLLAARVELNRDTGQAVAQGDPGYERRTGVDRLGKATEIKMDSVAEPFKDLDGDLTVHPNQRIGFHADARYNVYDLGLREANVDIRVTYPRVSVTVAPASASRATAGSCA
jgi:lipopolysaccharide assembly outer membrane protein LptD (OstA)